MIRLKSLTLRRGLKVLLDRADLTLHPGQKIGVVGANGAGKSSFFALLRGELHADAGDLELPPRLVIGHVAQETPALPVSALDYVLDGDAELRALEAELAAVAGDGIQHGELLGKLEAIDGYSAPARAGKLLAGLGFSSEEMSRPVSTFSGGWRMRLNLAQALMCRSDILLLDEPTNHLDLETVVWLEGWLRSYQGMLLIISHDRDFLDATINGILHVDAGKLDLYTGNYASFEAQRAEKLSQQQQAYDKQQREIAHLESFITRFKAKASKAKQAQSRVKALERMETISAAHVDSPFTFTFREPESSPSPLIRLELATSGYSADKPLLNDLNLSLEKQARIGLLGVNGAGKSTLIKTLCGDLALLSGQRIEGKGLKIGYFAQHQLEHLRLDESPLWHLQKLDPLTREQDHRNYLGGFDFHGDMATGPVRPFSGGEKARLALALLIWQKPNLLLLDEPTNHLDIEMRQALTRALTDFDGAIILVSHDRHLLRATVDDFWLIEAGRVRPFDGDLDDYSRYSQERRAEANTALRASDGSADRKAQKREEAEARQRLASARKPIEQKLAKVEKALTPKQTEHGELTGKLQDAALYDAERKSELQQVLQREAELKAQIETLELEWLELSEQLEQLQA
ncbi:ATP-binding cassette, subfamily F, member 3 [Andreprevotia lacus DSM 23236]|jgi:ATP-binding cassette subfamily F protein 3|uniref:Probable ATP-binding protein YheS n=1 Tax=Andreprevotia lacus DSM 23236 TaxID=1121001 RepID=A0A1W1XIS0_9NEIS|nr:ATP-binding cassette domain-containing protein [Andreprevotia lacus]SMC23859.1 ATP-binding cassette, subfamily F, member 3 [Andreprevotia lacus DSM 23236]